MPRDSQKERAAMRTNPSDLAYAYRQVARVNHYVVGVHNHTKIHVDDYDAARVILIDKQNAVVEGSRMWKLCELALDQLDADRASMLASVNGTTHHTR